MTQPALDDDVRDMIAALGAAGADVLVVGAHALAAHGLPRATGDLDLLVRPTPDNATAISGVTFDEAWQTRVEVTVGDLTFAVIGRDALLRNKRATGRDKDLLDVRALEDG